MLGITNEQIMGELMQLRRDVEVRNAQIEPVIAAYNEEILPAYKLERAKIATLERDVKILHDKLIGNGKPGLVLEVDRLNQTMGQIRWLGGLTLAAVVSQLIYTLFTFKFP